MASRVGATRFDQRRILLLPAELAVPVGGFLGQGAQTLPERTTTASNKKSKF